jgi:SAM-dependent methyltransferase
MPHHHPPPSDRVRSDFDRIAALEDGTTDNQNYHRYLLSHLPSPCDTVAEIGCGSGALARVLASRIRRVVAVDFSPGMIEKARRQSTHYPNIEYHEADVRNWSMPAASVDCVVSVATVHHLDHDRFLQSAREWVRPGGRLLILDLVREETIVDILRSAVALPVSIALRLLRTGRLRMPRALREAWRAHGDTDRYLSMSEAKRLYGLHLPGAQVRRHFFWRYSVVWTKPR